MAEEVTKFMRPKKLELEVETIDGSMRRLECEKITRDMGKKVVEIGSSNKNSALGLYEQMAVYFGGKADDYSDVDVRVVTKVIAWMGEMLKGDPT